MSRDRALLMAIPSPRPAAVSWGCSPKFSRKMAAAADSFRFARLAGWAFAQLWSARAGRARRFTPKPLRTSQRQFLSPLWETTISDRHSILHGHARSLL